MPKIVKIQQFSTFVDSVFTQNHDFWREKSNYPGKSDISKFTKLKFFDSKIQIHNYDFFLN